MPIYDHDFEGTFNPKNSVIVDFRNSEPQLQLGLIGDILSDEIYMGESIFAIGFAQIHEDAKHFEKRNVILYFNSAAQIDMFIKNLEEHKQQFIKE